MPTKITNFKSQISNKFQISKSKIKGFTLIELIIVLTIVAILVVIALVLYRSQFFKGNDARRKADIARIKIALEEYEKDKNCYPPPQLVVCKPGDGLKPYLNKIPCDPVTGASYFYDYENSACPGWFRIFTNLQNTADSAVTVGIGPNSAFNFYLGSGNSPNPVSTLPSGSSGGGSGGNGGGSSGGSNFYGCIGGACAPISWDPSRPGPACDPNYQNSSCYGQCGPQANECIPWR